MFLGKLIIIFQFVVGNSNFVVNNLGKLISINVCGRQCKFCGYSMGKLICMSVCG